MQKGNEIAALENLLAMTGTQLYLFL